MTVVIGTAGHIDHGKTALLRALTGIDADRLPEERERGMTIDVGYAHVALADGLELDFVDVPGHDRLIGNMLVGAGEIDAVMLVVAADDGPRAQTLEHLALLDALAVSHGIAVVTKIDVAGEARTAEVVRDVEGLITGTSLEGSPVLAVSSVRGDGIGALNTALIDLRHRVADAAAARATSSGTRIAIDRVFAVKGRGMVVTGTLRGRPIGRGATLRIVPGAGREVRVREIQVHGRTVESAGPGRTALNLVGVKAGDLHRGMVLTDDPAVVASDRVLVQVRGVMSDRGSVRVHVGTASVDGAIARTGREALVLGDGSAVAILRLAAPTAVAPGDRLVLRRGSGSDRVVGGTVLDVAPPRGVAARRRTPERLERLASAIAAGDRSRTAAALVELNGVAVRDGAIALADDIREAVAAQLVAFVGEATAGGPAVERPALGAVRTRAARAIRREATVARQGAAGAAASLVEQLVADGRLVRDQDRIYLPGTAARQAPAAEPALAAAMDRLERALATNAPPSLSEAATDAACPEAGVRELERSGRIVVLEPNLAYAAATYEALAARAVEMAARGPLTPAAFRDATGTSRKFVMAILEDQDRRQVLRRTPDGHVLGPRAPAVDLRSG
jgi:selenocysteine-specific elongation factor